jgi:hypothetical protein
MLRVAGIGQICAQSSALENISQREYPFSEIPLMLLFSLSLFFFFYYQCPRSTDSLNWNNFAVFDLNIHHDIFCLQQSRAEQQSYDRLQFLVRIRNLKTFVELNN